MAAHAGDKPVAVYGAIVANLVIAIAKFMAAFFTGSSSMLSEAFHSVVDTGNQLLLLFGVGRSKKAPDDTHPFGYGQELYFWALIVAMLLFALGGGVSLYEGVKHIQHPEPITDPIWNYVVLGIAALAEGSALMVALRELGKERRPGESLFKAFQRSKDPAVFVVVAEDTAALLGIVTALVGITLAVVLDAPMLDGIASCIIGVILVSVSVLLVHESRALVMGESAHPDMVRSIREIATRDGAVKACRAF